MEIQFSITCVALPKNDLNENVELIHAEHVASQLRIKFNYTLIDLSVNIKNYGDKIIEKSEPTKKLRVVEIKKTRVIEFDGNLTVNELADAFGISSEEFQKRLPDDANAKSDNDKPVKPSHAKEVASQLDIEFKRVKKASSVDIDDTKEKDIEKSESFNNKKVVDIDNITSFPEVLSAFSITREQFLYLVSPDAKADYEKSRKWKKHYIIEVAGKLGIKVKYTQKNSSDDNNGQESSVKLPQNNAVLNESGIKQTHIPANSSPERRVIRGNNTSSSYQNKTYGNDRTIIQHQNIISQQSEDVIHLTNIPNINFENSKSKTLRQIYGVLYFMRQNNTFQEAAKATLYLFKQDVNDYQTIYDKCSRCFAGSVSTFQSWFNSGRILDELNSKFGLSNRDYNIFKKLLSR